MTQLEILRLARRGISDKIKWEEECNETIFKNGNKEIGNATIKELNEKLEEIELLIQIESEKQ